MCIKESPTIEEVYVSVLGEAQQLTLMSVCHEIYLKHVSLIEALCIQVA